MMRFVVLAVFALTASFGCVPAVDRPKADAAGEPLPGDALPGGAVVRLGSGRGALSGEYLVALGPDYTTYATPEPGRAVAVRAVRTGDLVRACDGRPWAGQSPFFVSADGSRAAVPGDRRMAIWDLRAGRQLCEVGLPREAVAETYWEQPLVALSGDGSILAVGTTAGTPAAVTLWDATTGEQLRRVEIAGPGAAPALSADGKLLAVWPPAQEPSRNYPPVPVPGDGRIRLVEVATGRETRTLRPAGGAVRGVTFSADGRTVAARTGYQWVEWWDMPTGRANPVVRMVGLARPVAVAVAADGSAVAAMDEQGVIRRWARDGGQPEVTDPPVDLSGSRSPGLGFAGGRRVIGWGYMGHFPAVWEAPGGKLLSVPAEHRSGVRSVGFLPGGAEVLTTDGHGVTIRWDRATGKPLGRVPVRETGPGSEFYSMTVTPDATRGLGSETFHLYDPRTGTREVTFPRSRQADLPRYRHGPLVPSPDLTRVAILYFPEPDDPDHLPCDVWDIPGRRKLVSLRLPKGFGPDVGFSPSGARLVSAAYLTPDPAEFDRTGLRLVVTGWDVATGKKLSEVVDREPNGQTRPGVVAASETSALVGCGGRLRAVDFERGVMGDDIDAGAVAGWPPVFDAAGDRFAVPVRSAPDQYGVQVYDWPRGRLLHTFAGHTSPPGVLVFAPDGRTLASSADTAVFLWDVADSAPKK
ncbi:MAG: hypothetical protein K2X87_02940 [Gemmataceae bacterium]|nr:hypothetical protein [Gemmataceae bacterium]